MALAAAFALIAVLEYWLDPNCAFNGPGSQSAFAFTANPYHAKVEYLEKRPEAFDAFIIGGSRAGALTPALSEAYFPGHHFYNFFVYSADEYDNRKDIEYLLDRQKPRFLIVQISLTELAAFGSHRDLLDPLASGQVGLFYAARNVCGFNREVTVRKLKFFLGRDLLIGQAVIDPLTGIYDRSRWSGEDLQKNQATVLLTTPRQPSNPKAAKANFRATEAYLGELDDQGIPVVLIISPETDSVLDSLDTDTALSYLGKLAKLHDFWNFADYTDIAGNAENFYDINHYNAKIAKFIFERIAGGKDAELPEDFGFHVDYSNSEAYLGALRARYAAARRKIAVKSLLGGN